MPIGESELPSYAGMNQEATIVWRTFLRDYEDQFTSFSYNVRVGRGLSPGANANEATVAMWRAVTTKRIDAVGERLGQTWVFEVDPRPGLRALGQVNGYMVLLPSYYQAQSTIQGAVVCTYLGYDMRQVLRAHNILYFQYPPLKPPRLPPTFLPTQKAAL